ncbi:MAG: hypothetical protein KDD11_03235 [Acidobacteria bacterium]|nr:hypothetical protein [Acidobacteriota bacterium]
MALVTALLFVIAPIARAAQYRFVLVANRSVPVESLDRSEVSDIFLSQEAHWSDGSVVKPVTLRTAEVREEFAKVIHGKDDLQLRKHWQRQIFTGRGSPPPERPSDEALLDYVARTPGAIGYVSANARIDSSSVKVVALR